LLIDRLRVPPIVLGMQMPVVSIDGWRRFFWMKRRCVPASA
jgi:hypothetical protein